MYSILEAVQKEIITLFRKYLFLHVHILAGFPRKQIPSLLRFLEAGSSLSPWKTLSRLFSIRYGPNHSKPYKTVWYSSFFFWFQGSWASFVLAFPRVPGTSLVNTRSTSSSFPISFLKYGFYHYVYLFKKKKSQ